ncbi:MAG: NYN domain-containing protein [Elusimicrobia bacterium]|nr:NYN domain-containing protein [Elusimicrobiota bacterium]
MEQKKIERLLEEKTKEIKEKNIKLDESERRCRALEKEKEKFERESKRVHELAAEVQRQGQDGASQTEMLRRENERLRTETGELKRRLDNFLSLKKAGLFIDFENIRLCWKHRFEQDPPMERLLEEAERLIAAPGGARVLALKSAYIVRNKTLRGCLEAMGYQVFEKEPAKKVSGEFTCNWDVGLALNVMEEANRLDVVAIASGDGDFLDLVESIRNRFKGRVAVEIAAVRGLTHAGLQQAALDGMINLHYLEAP